MKGFCVHTLKMRTSAALASLQYGSGKCLGANGGERVGRGEGVGGGEGERGFCHVRTLKVRPSATLAALEGGCGAPQAGLFCPAAAVPPAFSSLACPLVCPLFCP